MRKLLGVFLSMTLAVSMLAGCGGSGAAAGSSPEAEESVQEAEESMQEAEGDSAEADALEAEGEEKAPAEAEAPETDSAEAEAGGAVTENDGLRPLASGRSSRIGGLSPTQEQDSPDELTAEDVDRLDRAMRAYTPPADSFLVNNAKSFYYYENMTKDEQALYDGMYMCATDPTSEDNIAVAYVSLDPVSDEFKDAQTVAYYGLLYDHPELFWLYNYCEADLGYGVPYEQSGDGTYMVYYFINEPFDDFAEMMTEFNQAADDFLGDIDLTASEDVIAKDIHDKLIDEVSYNLPICEDTSYASYSNLAHTAYGALVADSDGNANCAVCDGYSLAYLYLLQQAGIDAAVVVGLAGSSPEEWGGHAWNVVKLGGDWYEVDSTWDDIGLLDEDVESIREADPVSYAYYHEALSDPEYRGKLEHALCNLTTDDITDYEPDDYYDYYTQDGKYVIRLQDSSMRVRSSSSTVGYEATGMLMEYAPIAEGVAFAPK